jgi:hypothetical protein
MNRAERRRQRAMERRGEEDDLDASELKLTPKGEAFFRGLPILPDEMPPLDDGAG